MDVKQLLAKVCSMFKTDVLSHRCMCAGVPACMLLSCWGFPPLPLQCPPVIAPNLITIQNSGPSAAGGRSREQLALCQSVHHGCRGYNMIKQCGPQLALVIPDARAERTKPQVCVCVCTRHNGVLSVVPCVTQCHAYRRMCRCTVHSVMFHSIVVSLR